MKSITLSNKTGETTQSLYSCHMSILTVLFSFVMNCIMTALI